MSKSSVPCKRAMRSSGLSWEGIRPKLGIILDRKSTRLNSSHLVISYAVFCLKKKSCPGGRRGYERPVGQAPGVLPGGDRLSEVGREVVRVELDHGRLDALLQQERDREGRPAR